MSQNRSFGRQLTLIEYEDEATRVALEPRQARCFALLSREAVADVGIVRTAGRARCVCI